MFGQEEKPIIPFTEGFFAIIGEENGKPLYGQIRHEAVRIDAGHSRLLSVQPVGSSEKHDIDLDTLIRLNPDGALQELPAAFKNAA